MNELQELDYLMNASEDERNAYYAKQHEARMSAIDAKIGAYLKATEGMTPEQLAAYNRSLNED